MVRSRDFPPIRSANDIQVTYNFPKKGEGSKQGSLYMSVEVRSIVISIDQRWSYILAQQTSTHVIALYGMEEQARITMYCSEREVTGSESTWSALKEAAKDAAKQNKIVIIVITASWSHIGLSILHTSHTYDALFTSAI